MTPRSVIIWSFAFACAVIGGSLLIFAWKGHAPPPYEVPLAAAPDSVPQEPSQALQELAPRQPESAKPPQEPAQPPLERAQLPQAPAQSLQNPADRLPIIAAYELKKDLDAKRVIARDPKAFWIRQIVTRIEDEKVELSHPLERPAAVKLEFVVGRDGTLESKTISQSSGSDEADKAALAMLERAQPFPPMPEGLQENDLTFSLPVRFQ